jgi:hypothetical protein
MNLGWFNRIEYGELWNIVVIMREACPRTCKDLRLDLKVEASEI